MSKKKFYGLTWVTASSVVLVLSLTATVVLVDYNRRHAEKLKDQAMNETMKMEKEKNAKEEALVKYKEEEQKRIAAVEALKDKDRALNGSREELARAYETLKIKEQELEVANAGLNKKNSALLGEKTKSDSRILSAKALYMLHQNNNHADAFKLATEAFRMDPTNKEACAVLDELMTGRQDYFERTGGPALKTEDIIKKLTPNYGTINSDSKDKIIKGQWPASLKKIK